MVTYSPILLLKNADLVAIESPEENDMIQSWAHSYRDDHVIIGGQWIYMGQAWSPIWVATNQTMSYMNFYGSQGSSGGSSGQYFYMMPAYGGGRWGDYSGGTESFVCESST